MGFCSCAGDSDNANKKTCWSFETRGCFSVFPPLDINGALDD